MAERIEVDILIVGAGPSGLMAALWMARCGISTLVIDKRDSHTKVGRADGIESRTLEILDSFGLGDRIWAESNRTVEVCVWNQAGSGLRRDSVTPDSPPGLSRYQESTLGQGEVERHMLSLLSAYPTVKVLRQASPISLDIDAEKIEDVSSHCIHVRVERTNNEDRQDSPLSPKMGNGLSNGALNGAPNGASESGTEEFLQGSRPRLLDVKARYLLGCDGARSWVRKRLDLPLESEQTDGVWGVADCIPLTNFPDIRKRCIIRSEAGNMMIIPRERKLIRVYVQLVLSDYGLSQKDQAVIITEATRKVLYPYTFSAKSIEWTTIYRVGQRLCKQLSVDQRIFLAGDAIHMHSPKAGQGMNISMQDTFNLGWKIASVLRGVARPQILSTYQQERLPVAERLIAFDKRIYAEISRSRIAKSDKPSAPTQPDGLEIVLQEENSSASGLGVIYSDNILISPPHQNCRHSREYHKGISSSENCVLAKNLIVGARFPSEPVLRQSDSQKWHLQQLLTSTGQWYLIVFGGDISKTTQLQRVNELGEALLQDPCIRKLDHRRGEGQVGTLRVYLVHSTPRVEVDAMVLPDIFMPFDEEEGYDYSKIFADNEYYHGGGGKAYDNYGITSEGCMVLVRPDQHVAFLGDLEDVDRLSRFITGFMCA